MKVMPSMGNVRKTAKVRLARFFSSQLRVCRNKSKTKQNTELCRQNVLWEVCVAGKIPSLVLWEVCVVEAAFDALATEIVTVN